MTLIFRVLLLAIVASHALSDQLTAGQNDWPPFFSKARTDQGIAIALVREIFAKSGYQVEFNDTPWSRAIATVKSGQMDILPGVWDNAERKQYLIYSEPYLYNRIVFIKRKGDDFEFQGKETTGSMRRRVEVPQYSQVGNAVSPFLAFAVGKMISGALGLDTLK